MKKTLLFVFALAVIPVGVDAQAPDLEETRARAEQGYAPAQSILGLMYQYGQGVPEIVTSGDINLISDEQLHSTLLKFSYAQHSQELTSNHIISVININLPHFYSVVSFGIGDVNFDQSLGADFHIKYDIDELIGDESFRNTLGNIAMLQAYMRGQLYTSRDRLDELITAINGR